MTMSPLAKETIRNQAMEAQIEQMRRQIPNSTNVSNAPKSEELLSNTELPPNDWFWEEPLMVKDRIDNGIIIWRPATPFEKAQMEAKKV